MSNLFKLQEAAGSTLFAIAIIVIVIIALLFIILLQARIIRKTKMEANINEVVNIQPSEVYPNSDFQHSTIKSYDARNEEEIVAAITAALCVYTNLSNSEFKIKSIKRVSGNDSVWRKSGIV